MKIYSVLLLVLLLLPAVIAAEVSDGDYELTIINAAAQTTATDGDSTITIAEKAVGYRTADDASNAIYVLPPITAANKSITMATGGGGGNFVEAIKAPYHIIEAFASLSMQSQLLMIIFLLMALFFLYLLIRRIMIIAGYMREKDSDK